MSTSGSGAVVGVSLLTIRRRPLGNALILAGVAAAGAGSAVAGLGVAETAGFVALGAFLLYLGILAQGKNFVRDRLIRQHPG